MTDRFGTMMSLAPAAIPVVWLLAGHRQAASPDQRAVVSTDRGAVSLASRLTPCRRTFVVPLRLDHVSLGVVDGCGPHNDVVMHRGAGTWSRPIPYAIVGAACAVLLVHVVGWGAAVSVLWQNATPHVPRIQSAIVLSLGLFYDPGRRIGRTPDQATGRCHRARGRFRSVRGCAAAAAVRGQWDHGRRSRTRQQSGKVRAAISSRSGRDELSLPPRRLADGEP